MRTKDFLYFGYDKPIVNFAANCLDIYNQGKERVQFFNTGADIYMCTPTMQIENVMKGKSTVSFGGKFFVWDEANNLFCELEFKID